jgi:hypothetical protein
MGIVTHERRMDGLMPFPHLRFSLVFRLPRLDHPARQVHQKKLNFF